MARPPLRRLGRSDVEVSPLGLGCWRFGGSGEKLGARWTAVPQATVDAIVAAALEGGVTWFDTAEIYGHGASERALAHALRASGRVPGEIVVATKWWPTWRFAGSLRRTLRARVAALMPYPIDLHQVHQPTSLSSIGAQMAVLAQLVREGATRAVGVSNFSAAEMRAAHAALAAHGVPLASNQVRWSLIDRRVVEHRIVFDTLRMHRVRYVGNPYFVRGHYVVRSYDRFGRVTFVEVNPYTGRFIGFIRL